MKLAQTVHWEFNRWDLTLCLNISWQNAVEISSTTRSCGLMRYDRQMSRNRLERFPAARSFTCFAEPNELWSGSGISMLCSAVSIFHRYALYMFLL